MKNKLIVAGALCFFLGSAGHLAGAESLFGRGGSGSGGSSDTCTGAACSISAASGAVAYQSLTGAKSCVGTGGTFCRSAGATFDTFSAPITTPYFVSTSTTVTPFTSTVTASQYILDNGNGMGLVNLNIARDAMNIRTSGCSACISIDGSAAQTITANMPVLVASSKTKACVALNGAGSQTATVLSGAVCICNDSTSVLACKASVSSTTLTMTVTGGVSDTVCYLCL